MPSVENHATGEPGQQCGGPGKVFWGHGAGSVGRMGSELCKEGRLLSSQAVGEQIPKAAAGSGTSRSLQGFS